MQKYISSNPMKTTEILLNSGERLHNKYIMLYGAFVIVSDSENTKAPTFYNANEIVKMSGVEELKQSMRIG